jgi:hypothetical protein
MISDAIFSDRNWESTMFWLIAMRRMVATGKAYPVQDEDEGEKLLFFVRCWIRFDNQIEDVAGCRVCGSF